MISRVFSSFFDNFPVISGRNTDCYHRALAEFEKKTPQGPLRPKTFTSKIPDSRVMKRFFNFGTF